MLAASNTIGRTILVASVVLWVLPFPTALAACPAIRCRRFPSYQQENAAFQSSSGLTACATRHILDAMSNISTSSTSPAAPLATHDDATPPGSSAPPLSSNNLTSALPAPGPPPSRVTQKGQLHATMRSVPALVGVAAGCVFVIMGTVGLIFICYAGRRQLKSVELSYELDHAMRTVGMPQQQPDIMPDGKQHGNAVTKGGGTLNSTLSPQALWRTSSVNALSHACCSGHNTVCIELVAENTSDTQLSWATNEQSGTDAALGNSLLTLRQQPSLDSQSSAVVRKRVIVDLPRKQ